MNDDSALDRRCMTLRVPRLRRIAERSNFRTAVIGWSAVASSLGVTNRELLMWCWGIVYRNRSNARGVEYAALMCTKVHQGKASGGRRRRQVMAWGFEVNSGSADHDHPCLSPPRVANGSELCRTTPLRAVVENPERRRDSSAEPPEPPLQASRPA